MATSSPPFGRRYSGATWSAMSVATAVGEPACGIQADHLAAGSGDDSCEVITIAAIAKPATMPSTP